MFTGVSGNTEDWETLVCLVRQHHSVLLTREPLEFMTSIVRQAAGRRNGECDQIMKSEFMKILQ